MHEENRRQKKSFSEMSEGGQVWYVSKWIIAASVFLILFFGSFAMVDPGERGVVVRLGKVTDRILNEGFTFKKPLIEKVVEMDVKTQLVKIESNAASKDLQDVEIDVAVNYKLDVSKVNNIYQQVRQKYHSVWVKPALTESVKAAAAKFTAEELITKRTEAREEMSRLVTEKLNDRGIIVEAFNIVNLEFSESFDDAIEAKVTAAQDALAAENKLAQVEFERQQRIVQAQGEAEAIRIQIEALNVHGGENYVRLQEVDRWNGSRATTVVNGNAPIILDASDE